MIHPRSLLLGLAFAVGLSGCSTPVQPEVKTEYRILDWREPVLDDPAMLLQQAKLAFRDKQPAIAYRYAASIRTLHPDSPQLDEAFDLATLIFRLSFTHYRIEEPEGVWVKQEPTFLYEWGSTYLRGDTFPQKQMDDLLVGMPLFFYWNFQSFTAARPYSDHWTVEVESDNNKIEAVRGIPASPAASAAQEP